MYPVKIKSSNPFVTISRFLRPVVPSGQQTIRTIPANAVPLKLENNQIIALPRVQVTPALATSPRPTCLVLPNQPVPQREVFQRPLPPANIRPQMVRAILIPRPGLSPGQVQQQQQTVIISPSGGQLQHQQTQQLLSHQRLQAANTGTPLPNIQLPSEPLPITAEMQQQLTSSRPSPAPSPASLDSSNFVQNHEVSQNGFVGNGNTSSLQQIEDGGMLKHAFPIKQQQNSQKIFIQVKKYFSVVTNVLV